MIYGNEYGMEKDNDNGRMKEGRKKRNTRRKTDIYIGTWNVRSLYRPGALKMLLDQTMNLKPSIIALQEIRWTGRGTLEKREANIFYSCSEERHEFGTGFVVHRQLKHLVIGFTPISPRLSILRIKGKFSNYSIINVHAPTEESEDEEKGQFYELLERAYDNCPGHDIKIIAGDLNAQVGTEQIFRPTIGPHSKHTISNDNGIRIILFATSRNMIVGSTLFPHRGIHKGTWKSPDGKTVNQIDHVLIDARHKSDLLDVRSLRGPNIDSDHYLVWARVRARISNASKGIRTNNQKYNTAALESAKLESDTRKD